VVGVAVRVYNKHRFVSNFANGCNQVGCTEAGINEQRFFTSFNKVHIIGAVVVNHPGFGCQFGYGVSVLC
jgi:hypothetical protein